MRTNGRARVNARRPSAWAICDRCSFRYLHSELTWAYEWAGSTLQNQRILVCDICNDIPNPQLRTFIPPPDPMPVQNPRPDLSDQGNPTFLVDDNGVVMTDQYGNPIVVSV